MDGYDREKRRHLQVADQHPTVLAQWFELTIGEGWFFCSSVQQALVQVLKPRCNGKSLDRIPPHGITRAARIGR